VNHFLIGFESKIVKGMNHPSFDDFVVDPYGKEQIVVFC
jgi:hypothetical protein